MIAGKATLYYDRTFDNYSHGCPMWWDVDQRDLALLANLVVVSPTNSLIYYVKRGVGPAKITKTIGREPDRVNSGKSLLRLMVAP